MTLPPSDIERIEANAKFYIYTLLATNGDVPWDQTKDAYVSGAQAEAVRGREMERTRFIEFLQWLSEEKAEYSILYGGEPERFCSIDHDYTSEQIADLFLDTQKWKG